MRQLVRGPYGEVEVVAREWGSQWVLYFHGGHESAVTASAVRLYEVLGYSTLAISRPGYGATSVGPLGPMAFAKVVEDICATLGRGVFAAVVGVSFGGQQAIAYASQFPEKIGSLILHSAAPSSLPYPDQLLQRLLGPLVFHPAVESTIWALVSRLVASYPEFGLRIMAAPLSTLPVKTWLGALSAADREQMRELFSQMRSGSGFNNDMRYATRAGTSVRRAAQLHVGCPTLITASRSDRGVSWSHAEDFAATIPNAQLQEVPAASHLFWIGPTRPQMISVISEFLASVRG